MHQTSVRFGNETWDQLIARCAREGIPVAQFIREATVAHLALSAERTRQAVADVRLARELTDLRTRVERLEQRQR